MTSLVKNQTITCYHCSPVKIDKFDLSQGCHFGGHLSSLEAGLRKIESGSLYVHKLNITFNKSIRVDDLCNKQAWDEQCIDMRKAGVDIAIYRNAHEPDFTSSYFVVDAQSIQITNVSVITTEQAEEVITEALY